MIAAAETGVTDVSRFVAEQLRFRMDPPAATVFVGGEAVAFTRPIEDSNVVRLEEVAQAVLAPCGEGLLDEIVARAQRDADQTCYTALATTAHGPLPGTRAEPWLLQWPTYAARNHHVAKAAQAAREAITGAPPTPAPVRTAPSAASPAGPPSATPSPSSMAVDGSHTAVARPDSAPDAPQAGRWAAAEI